PSSAPSPSVVSSGGSSSSSPSLQPSTTVPGTSVGRTEDPKKRNDAGSPTTSPNSTSGSVASLPSSIPNGATHSAFTGGAMPGTAGAAVSTPTEEARAGPPRVPTPRPRRAGPHAGRPRRAAPAGTG